jgi:cell division protein FtsB
MSIHALSRIFYITTGVLVSFLAVFAVLLFFGQEGAAALLARLEPELERVRDAAIEAIAAGTPA